METINEEKSFRQTNFELPIPDDPFILGGDDFRLEDVMRLNRKQHCYELMNSLHILRPNSLDLQLGFLHMNGVITIMRSAPHAKKPLYCGQQLCYSFPGCGIATPQTLAKETNFLMRNQNTGCVLYSLSYSILSLSHFFGYMTFCDDMRDSNCAMMDDGRVVMLEDLTHPGSGTKLVCYPGTWVINYDFVFAPTKSPAGGHSYQLRKSNI